MFLLDHDDGGSIGVVLNRPTRTPVEEVVPSWGLVAAPPAFVFSGGPVSVNGAICLARTFDAVPPRREEDPGAPRFQQVSGAIGTVDLHHGPDEVPVRLAEARVFAGYAGWGPGQLDEELEADAWYVLDAQESDVFDSEPDGLWPRVLRRQGGWLAVVARHPVDPSVN